MPGAVETMQLLRHFFVSIINVRVAEKWFGYLNFFLAKIIFPL